MSRSPSADPLAVLLTAYGNWLFARLPSWVINTLSPEQMQAIHRALTDSGASRPPINIRISIPLPRRRFFLTVVCGAEKRNPERRAHERTVHPLHTIGNGFFILGLATIFYGAAVIAVAMYSAILEP